MRMLFVHSLHKGLPALLTALVLSACGPSETQNDAPANFQWNLSASPSSIALGVPAETGTPSADPCTTNFLGITTIPVTFVVTDDRGVPRGATEITIFVDFAEGSVFNGLLPLTFLVDGAQVTVPYTTTTDNDGSKTVAIGFTIANGCTYAGSVTVTSGVLFAQTTFDVTVQ